MGQDKRRRVEREAAVKWCYLMCAQLILFSLSPLLGLIALQPSNRSFTLAACSRETVPWLQSNLTSPSEFRDCLLVIHILTIFLFCLNYCHICSRDTNVIVMIISTVLPVACLIETNLRLRLLVSFTHSHGHLLLRITNKIINTFSGRMNSSRW